VIITHYHRDTSAGSPSCSTALPSAPFVDHGPNWEDSDARGPPMPRTNGRSQEPAPGSQAGERIPVGPMVHKGADGSAVEQLGDPADVVAM